MKAPTEKLYYKKHPPSGDVFYSIIFLSLIVGGKAAYNEVRIRTHGFAMCITFFETDWVYYIVFIY